MTRQNYAQKIEEAHIGIFTRDWSKVKPDQINAKIRDSMRSFSYFKDYKDSAEICLTWLKKHDPANYKTFKRAEPWRFSMTLGALCQMHMDNAPLRNTHHEFMTRTFKGILDKIPPKPEEKVAKEGRTINDIRLGMVLEELEDRLDNFYRGTLTENDHKTYDLLKTHNLTKASVSKILYYYKPVLQEIEESLGKNEDLAYAYAHMSKPKRKKAIKFLEGILADCERYASNNTRKVIRKKKVKAVNTSKVQYMKESPSLKLVSIDPINIHGADMVFTFDVKKRELNRYVANKAEGLTITGTTIKNFDPEESGKKRIRANYTTYDDVRVGTKTRARKVFDDVKAVKQKNSGQLNENVILLKAFK